MSQAKQYIKAGHVVREAECPHGHGKSSDFLGPTADGWVFRCKKPFAMPHLFTAEPDKSAPQTQEGVEKWNKRHQRQAVKQRF